MEDKRKCARSAKDIPEAVMKKLNSGTLETANLVEWLAVDQKMLLESVLSRHKRTAYLQPVLSAIAQLKKTTVNTVNESIGTTLHTLATGHNDQQFLKIMSEHPADLVRCWAAYSIGKNEGSGISETLEKIRPFAADGHFGVREISWMAVREKIAADLAGSIEILSEWTLSDDENFRRFATEATRPRGVWCTHLPELKQNPALALPILEPLKSDASKYVRDSVGNWLNDAGKTQPVFIQQLCNRWQEESKTKETGYIIKKALRTICK